MLVLLVLALWRISDAAQAASPTHRTMNPALVWLLLIPVFQAFWNFKVFPAVSDSLAATLRDKGRDFGDCGRSIGMIWAIVVAAMWALHFVFWLTGGLLGFAVAVLQIVGFVALVISAVAYVVAVQSAKSAILQAERSQPPATSSEV